MAYFSSKVLEFHATLFTPRGNPHPWESKPWTWPMGLRPMLYSYVSGEQAGTCGGPERDCQTRSNSAPGPRTASAARSSIVVTYFATAARLTPASASETSIQSGGYYQ